MEDEYRLTTEEVRQNYDGDQELTDEQVEMIKDFVQLAAVITYEGALKEKAHEKKAGLHNAASSGDPN